MIPIFSEAIYSDQLAQQPGEAYWDAIRSLDLPMRTWRADEFDLKTDEVREACLKGERIVLALDEENWIASVDWKTGTVSFLGDADEEASHRLIEILDRLFESLRAKFGWAGIDGDYPKGLAQAASDAKVRWIFWLNYYGPAYLDAFGEKFFLNAPFASVHRLQHGVRCLLSAAPRNVSTATMRDLRNYFREKASMDIVAHPPNFEAT